MAGGVNIAGSDCCQSRNSSNPEFPICVYNKSLRYLLLGLFRAVQTVLDIIVLECFLALKTQVKAHLFVINYRVLI